MVVDQVFESSIAEAVLRLSASLSAHYGIAGVAFPEGAVALLVVEGAVIVRRCSEAVVVAGKTRQGAAVVGCCCSDGVLDGKPEHAHLELRRAQLDLARYGKCVQKGLGEPLAGQVVGIGAGSETEVGGIVPLAPGAYESCLQNEYHIFILLQQGLELLDVTQHNAHFRIHDLTVFVIVFVGETKYAFCPAVTKSVHVGLEQVEERLRDVAVHEVGQVESEVPEGMAADALRLDFRDADGT